LENEENEIMSVILFKSGTIFNEGKKFVGDVLVKDGRIEQIGTSISYDGNHEEVNIEGKLLLPGLIDDQVHFREPGLIHKGDIFTESRAAVAGGITSYME
jgi:dihydroorotase